MEREYKMPRIVLKKLKEMVDYNVEGPNTEDAVLDAASELGYEVEDETTTRHHGSEEGGYMHNVKVVNKDGCVAWLHFNHPAPAYARHNDEWYWYPM